MNGEPKLLVCEFQISVVCPTVWEHFISYFKNSLISYCYSEKKEINISFNYRKLAQKRLNGRSSKSCFVQSVKGVIVIRVTMGLFNFFPAGVNRK